MSKCAIPLFSGIGNVIQSIPFIESMREKYDDMVGYDAGLDFKETMHLVSHMFNYIYKNKKKVPSGYTHFRVPKRRSFSESESWFVDNNQKTPDKIRITNIAYTPSESQHKVVIWPECKENWPCKAWDKWETLANKLEDVAVIGLKDTPVFGKHISDYRGKLNLLQTGGIIKNAEIFIGNEGGMSHYAAALGVKTYVILGCSDPVKNMPPANSIPISKNLPCQPCQFKNMKKTNTVMEGCVSRKCITELTVKEVLSRL